MLLYDVASLGTPSNSISFNDDALDPYFRLTEERLLNREIDAFDIKIPQGMGDADFETLMGKTNFILTGTMYPGDEASYDTGIKKLRKLASLQIEQADAASDQGYVPYKFIEYDGYNKLINLKVLYVDLPKSTRNGLKQPFRLFCKVKYPVIFGQTGLSATVGSTTATVTGSSIVPIVVPFVVGGTTYTSNGSITNPGDLPTYPSITINGPITSPRITNSTTGEYIELSGLNLATTSDTVIISYDQDSMSITQAGNSVFSNLTTAATFFKINPGINNLSLTGATVGSGASASVTALPAWPLS